MINFSSLVVPRNCGRPRTATGYTDRSNVDCVNTMNQHTIFLPDVFIYESYCTGWFTGINYIEITRHLQLNFNCF